MLIVAAPTSPRDRVRPRRRWSASSSSAFRVSFLCLARAQTRRLRSPGIRPTLDTPGLHRALSSRGVGAASSAAALTRAHRSACRPRSAWPIARPDAGRGPPIRARGRRRWPPHTHRSGRGGSPGVCAGGAGGVRAGPRAVSDHRRAEHSRCASVTGRVTGGSASGRLQFSPIAYQGGGKRPGRRFGGPGQQLTAVKWAIGYGVGLRNGSECGI